MQEIKIRISGEDEEEIFEAFFDWWDEVGQHDCTLWGFLHSKGFDTATFETEIIGDVIKVRRI